MYQNLEKYVKVLPQIALDVVKYACSKNVNMACVTLDMKSGFDLLQMDLL